MIRAGRSSHILPGLVRFLDSKLPSGNVFLENTLCAMVGYVLLPVRLKAHRVMWRSEVQKFLEAFYMVIFCDKISISSGFGISEADTGWGIISVRMISYLDLSNNHSLGAPRFCTGLA